jgi:hypothetical protein
MRDSARYFLLVLAIICYAGAGIVYANVSNPIGATIAMACAGTVLLILYLAAPAKWCDALVKWLTYANFPWF